MKGEIETKEIDIFEIMQNIFFVIVEIMKKELLSCLKKQSHSQYKVISLS